LHDRNKLKKKDFKREEMKLSLMREEKNDNKNKMKVD